MYKNLHLQNKKLGFCCVLKKWLSFFPSLISKTRYWENNIKNIHILLQSIAEFLTQYLLCYALYFIKQEWTAKPLLSLAIQRRRFEWRSILVLYTSVSLFQEPSSSELIILTATFSPRHSPMCTKPKIYFKYIKTSEPDPKRPLPICCFNVIWRDMVR